MKTLTSINSGLIMGALFKAKPATLTGKTAVENYKVFLQNNVMSAIALENSIISLTTTMRDPGLEGLVAVLKGLMPEAKRQVAVAYEQLSTENKELFMAAGTEAMDALSALYDYSADKIVSEIVSGKLNAWAANPVIARLIAYAKAACNTPKGVERIAVASEPAGESKSTLVPVLLLASLGEDGTLIAVDNMLFVSGTRGGLTYTSSLADYDVSTDVKTFANMIAAMRADKDMPNIMRFVDDIDSQICKALGIRSFSINLSGGIDELVGINGIYMSPAKAKAILMQNKDAVIAAMIMDDNAKTALATVNTAMQMFERYRGTIASGMYANKITAGELTYYSWLNVKKYVAIVADVRSGAPGILSVKAYDSAYSLLGDEYIVTVPPVHAALSQVYADNISDEAGRLSVRTQIMQKLMQERTEYEKLLSRIKAEQDELGTVIDPNEEKVTALNKLEKQVKESLSNVNAELSKLSE